MTTQLEKDIAEISRLSAGWSGYLIYGGLKMDDKIKSILEKYTGGIIDDIPDRVDKVYSKFNHY